MITKKLIMEDIERLSNIRDLVEVYEEIAATRMRQIRDSVLHSRDFLAGIGQIYKEVQSNYEHQIQSILHHKKTKERAKLSVIEKNGKSISVIIGANTGLYGDIIHRTLFLFLNGIKREQGDVMVIGRLTKAMVENAEPDLKFEYYDFPDSHIESEELKKIAEKLVNYEKITVYYGEFQNVAVQNPSQSVISDVKYAGEEKEEIKFRSLFEPSLEEIMLFFEHEIFASIFEQTMHEAQLAKFASRMITLDKSIENIKSESKKVDLQRRIVDHRSMNKKQMESLSGIALWSRGR